MELRHLRYFIAVAEELNFTRAAVRLNIAQPPLSVQIRRLEAEIGAQLLVREKRAVRLTDAGHLFLKHARESVAQAKQASAMARQADAGTAGRLAIGYIPSAAFSVLPSIVPAFSRKWPNVQLTFHGLTMAEKLEGLRRGELDVGFVWLPIPPGEFDSVTLVDEPMFAAVPAHHRLASVQAVSVRDLAREPLLLTSNPDTFQKIEQIFVQEGLRMNIAYRLENALALVNFVAMGLGCSLLPNFSHIIRQKGVVYRKLRPATKLSLAMIKLKDRQGLPELFFRFAADISPASR